MSANKSLKLVFFIVLVAILSLVAAFGLVIFGISLYLAIALITFSFLLMAISIVLNLKLYKCSACGKWLGRRRCTHCPHCGTDVD